MKKAPTIQGPRWTKIKAHYIISSFIIDEENPSIIHAMYTRLSTSPKKFPFYVRHTLTSSEAHDFMATAGYQLALHNVHYHDGTPVCYPPKDPQQTDSITPYQTPNERTPDTNDR